MLRRSGLVVVTVLALAAAGVGTGVSAAANVATTLSLSTSADPSALGSTVKFVAVVQSAVRGLSAPTGTVSFATSGSASTGAGPIAGCESVALVNGRARCSVTYTTAGSQTLTAIYGGSSEFAGSSGSLVQTVSQGATTTTLMSSDDPSSVGERVTYEAVVKGAKQAGTPTGTVSFATSGSASTGAGPIPGCTTVPLVDGVAACQASYADTGSQAIQASYSGSANFLTSNSVSLTQTVAAFATTLQLSSSADPSALGRRVRYTAAVTSSSSSGTVKGSVSFATSGSASTGAGPIAGCESVALVNGRARCSVTYTTAGSQTIKATYTPISGFAPSSDSLVQTVN